MSFDSNQIQLGISACVMGQQVRYDKSHKRSHFCVEELGKHVQYRPFCPEVAIGLPIPRPTIRQVRDGDLIKVCRPDGSGDVTQALQAYGRKIAASISHLSGFIFCQKSPSCGMQRVKVYHAHGKGSESVGVGAFAKEIMAANPLLPVEENGRLNDEAIRENFVLRVFAYHQWQCLQQQGLTKVALIKFHSKYKYLAMSHDPLGYKALGRLLARADLPLEEMAGQYISGLMSTLKKQATRKTHTNTLQHLQGYFKKELSKPEKQELSEQIHAYREGLVPLLVPLTLIKHYLLEYPKAYLAAQAYLAPYPADLRLRYSY